MNKIPKASFIKEYIETIRKLTGLSIAIRNYDCYPKTDKDLYLEGTYTLHRCDFCMAVKSSRVEDLACIAYEEKMERKGRKAKLPFFTRCRFGVEDVHLSIINKNEFLGSIVCGQVLLKKPSKEDFRKIVNALHKKSAVDTNKLKDIYFKMPVVEKTELEDIVSRMEILSKYIVEKYERGKLLRVLRSETVNDNDPGSKSRQESIIKRSVGFIASNFNKKITRDDVSRQFYLSPAYFSRLFRKHTGKSFTDHLIELRLNKAKLLMNNSMNPIKEIAENTGFKSPYYFSRIFKKKEGVSPKKYRASHQ